MYSDLTVSKSDVLEDKMLKSIIHAFPLGSCQVVEAAVLLPRHRRA